MKETEVIISACVAFYCKPSRALRIIHEQRAVIHVQRLNRALLLQHYRNATFPKKKNATFPLKKKDFLCFNDFVNDIVNDFNVKIVFIMSL